MMTLRPGPAPTLPLIESHPRWLLGTTTRTSTVLPAASAGGSADGVKDAAMPAIEAAKTALDREMGRAGQDDTPGASGDDLQATVTAARAAAQAALNSLRSGGGRGVEDGFGMAEDGAIASLQVRLFGVVLFISRFDVELACCHAWASGGGEQSAFAVTRQQSVFDRQRHFSLQRLVGLDWTGRRDSSHVLMSS